MKFRLSKRPNQRHPSQANSLSNIGSWQIFNYHYNLLLFSLLHFEECNENWNLINGRTMKTLSQEIFVFNIHPFHKIPRSFPPSSFARDLDWSYETLCLVWWEGLSRRSTGDYNCFLLLQISALFLSCPYGPISLFLFLSMPGCVVWQEAKQKTWKI